MLDTVSLVLLGLTALILLYTLGTKKSPDVSPFLLTRQAAVSPTREKGESAIYRSQLTPHGSPLLTVPEPGMNTVYDLMKKGLSRNPGNNFLGHRVGDSPFVWETFEQVQERMKNLGAGLIQLAGLASGAESMVGMFLKNSPAFIITDGACAMYNLVSVPMYDTFDLPALQYIISHTSISVVLISSANLEKAISGATPVLKHLVVTDATTVSDDLIQRAEAFKIKISTMKQVEAMGKNNPKPFSPPSPDDLHTICYTSGTTGTPKGVMLTHKNLVSGIAGFYARLPADAQLSPSDRHLSYLPASHMFERMILTGMTYSGAQIGFFRGEILKLFDDIGVLRPTIFPSVPRLLSRLYDKVLAGVSASPVKKALFNLAFSRKHSLMMESGIITRNTFWDKLVFGKIQARLGGCVRLMITGAAPIDHKIIEFLRVAVGCQVFEGYGQTETSATGCLTMWGDYGFKYGSHVGVPFPNCEIKLLDVPSMNYLATDKPNPRGEICFRGPITMKGYYKEPKKTSETLDKDGWIHTGDVGEILSNGTLKIVDRVKNIFKLSQGEYIAPEKVEMKIKTANVLQSFVYGDSIRSCLVAIVIPDPETALPWAKENGVKCTSLEQLCSSKEARALFMKEISQAAVKSGLHKFEIPKAISLHAEPMSVENGMLTPTFKVKRTDVKKVFEKEISSMYAELKE